MSGQSTVSVQWLERGCVVHRMLAVAFTKLVWYVQGVELGDWSNDDLVIIEHIGAKVEFPVRLQHPLDVHDGFIGQNPALLVLGFPPWVRKVDVHRDERFIGNFCRHDARRIACPLIPYDTKYE